jgi:dUTP pyrophosphatase
VDKKRPIIRIKKLAKSEGLPMPEKASKGSSGFDLLACVDEDLEIGPGSFVPTGLSIELPAGYEAQVRPRSGLALRDGITVLNSPGTIDSDYRGEVGVILVNHGGRAFKIRRGDRIAQLVFCEVCHPELEQVDSLEDTERSSGGFGHTGIR